MVHLLRERGEAGEDDDADDDEVEGGDKDGRLLKAVVGSGLLRPTCSVARR